MKNTSLLSEKMIIEICKDPDPKMNKYKREFIKLPDLSEEAMKILAKDPSFETRFDLAVRKNLPKSIIEILKKDEDVTVRNALKSSGNLVISRVLGSGEKLSNEEILERIEKLDSWNEMRNFIISLDLTSRQMGILANHEDEWVRRGLVLNSNLTNEEAMIKLSNDEDEWVRYGLAKNPNLTSEKAMIKLSNCRDSSVRYWLAKNPNITEKVMLMLANDRNDDVRWGLAQNPNLTNEKAMIKLTNDKKKEVRKGLTQNPNLTEKVMLKLSNNTKFVREKLSCNLNLTEELMIKLSNDEDVDVKQSLAKNPSLTEEIMLKLANDEEWRVRWGLTENPNLINKEVLIKLTSDEFQKVSKNAFRKLKKLNSLKSEDLGSAYNLIKKVKYIGRENFEETFNYIANKFPELSELAKIFKRIILKGKKDLK